MEVQHENAVEDDEDDEENNEDNEFGQIMNEIAAQNFADKETIADEAMTGDDRDDEEIAQLKEYLAQLQTEFREQQAEDERELT